MVTISTERLIIRPFREADLKNLVALINDKTIYRFTRVPHPYTMRHARDYFKECKELAKKGTKYSFGFFDKETKELVGGASLMSIKKADNAAKLGYWIGQPFRGKKYALEASRALIEWAFKTKKLNRIEIGCATVNVYSRYVIEKLGATYEGTLRQAAKLGGKYYDMCIYSILKKEWSKIKNKSPKKVHLK